MKENWGFILLGIWLIATGVLSFVSVGIPFLGIILGLVALLAGIFIIFGK